MLVILNMFVIVKPDWLVYMIACFAPLLVYIYPIFRIEVNGPYSELNRGQNFMCARGPVHSDHYIDISNLRELTFFLLSSSSELEFFCCED